MPRQQPDTSSQGSTFKTTKIKFVASLVFILIAGFAIFVSFAIRKDTRQNNQFEFEQEIIAIESAIQNRFEIYINALRAGLGLFKSSETVTRDEWKSFVQGFNLQSFYPGIQGLGYSKYILPADKTAFEQEIRDQGFPDFTIYPDSIRPEYTAIIYLEPSDQRNRQAFGYDMFTDPVRQAAMSGARDTNSVQLSGKVQLVQEIDEDIQPGFLAYIPFYGTIQAPATIAERRDSLTGYVYAPFRAHDFIQGILSKRQHRIDFAVFDGNIPTPDISQLLFSTNNAEFTSQRFTQHLFAERRELIVGNHVWTIFYTDTPTFLSHINRIEDRLYAIILIVGLAMAILIGITIYLFGAARQRALHLAENMTNDLRIRTEENEKNRKKIEATNKELKKKTKELAKKIEEVEKINDIMLNREEKMIKLKQKIQQQQPKKNA